MSTPILICDDSGFARRQMARSLPDGWDVDISFAENGEQALALVREGKGDVVLQREGQRSKSVDSRVSSEVTCATLSECPKGYRCFGGVCEACLKWPWRC